MQLQIALQIAILYMQQHNEILRYYNKFVVFLNILEDVVVIFIIFS